LSNARKTAFAIELHLNGKRHRQSPECSDHGGGFERGSWAATVEALHQAGVVHDQALRVLGRYHRPALLDPHGRLGAEAVPEFVLAPVGELIG
jgi:hypothetical protein